MDVNTLSPYVRRAMYSTIRAPRVFADRVILDYEIILVTDGEAYITVDGQTYTARKNDVIFFRPNVAHRMEIREGAFVQPHIHFDAVFDRYSYDRYVVLKSSNELTEEERKMIQPDLLRDCQIPVVFTPEDSQRFHKYFFSTIETIARKREYMDMICRANLLMLLRVILKQFCTDQGKSPKDNYCEAIREYLDMNPDQVITLDDLEKLFKVNKFTMIRNFKNAYGESVISYYNARRAEFAQKILKRTSLSVTEVATNLNFTDIYSFSRFFKKHTGMSPKEYRDSLK